MKLSWKPYNLLLKYPFAIAGYSRTSTPVVLVELEHEGVIGYGEASLPQYLGETQQSVIQFLKQVNLAAFKDPFDIESVTTYLDEMEEDNTAAKAAIDIALHDLQGKIEGEAWHQMWRLNKEDTPHTSYTIGIDREEIIRKKTLEAIKKGFSLLKVKLDGQNDKSIIDTIRSVTDLPLFVDANQSWKDRVYAQEMSHWLQERGVELIEQPFSEDNLEDSAWLTETSPIPIFADESVQRITDIHRIKGAFSGVNIKLMKCTGMNEARKMIHLARSFDLMVMIGCMTETSCAISAAAQLSPLADFADLDGNLLIKNDCFKGVQIKKGKIMLNDRPGIGVKYLR